MPIIQLEALDTLFFRDGKPFTMGEDTYVSSSNLPYPSVFWGALFSSLLFEGKVTTKDKEKLKINGIYLYKESNKDILLPAPADLFINKDEKLAYHSITDYQLVENLHYEENSEHLEGILMINAEWVEQPNNQFILASTFNSSYCNMKLLHTIDMLKNSFIKSNDKIGIGLDKDLRTSQEGKLYRINMQEYDREWSFLVDLELKDIEIQSKGIIRLGGEGKMAAIKQLDAIPFSLQELKEKQEKIKLELENKDFFKIVFVSPFLYKNKNSLKDLFSKQGVTLVSAVMGKPINIGGFDVEKQQPKPMLKGLPAGCVFICHKEVGKNLNEFISYLNTELAEFQSQGFNQFYFTQYSN